MAKDTLLVKAKVKDYVKEEGLMSSSDLIDAVNEEVYRRLERAMERAKANGRKTVQDRDV